MKQRWHVVTLKQKRQRAAKQVDKQVAFEPSLLKNSSCSIQAKRFNGALDAIAAAIALANSFQFHNLYWSVKRLNTTHQETGGRPKKGQKRQA